MKNFITIITLLIFALGLSSCEKVIPLELNSADPKIVVSGDLSTDAGPYQIKLTRSINYDQDNTFPGVTGATVHINDNNGTDELLVESSPGVYETTTMQGVAGRTYDLSILDGSENYTSSITMPSPVEIDSLYIGLFEGFGQQIPTLNVVVQDPPSEANFYRIYFDLNGTKFYEPNYYSDFVENGEEITMTLIDTDLVDDAQLGDTINIRVQSIDEGSFEYLRTRDALSQGSNGFGTTTPDNPTSNIEGGALGYFRVGSYSQTKQLIVQ